MNGSDKGDEGPLIKAEGLKVYFPVKKGLFGIAGFVRAVDGVSLEIGRGETLALVGESGSGKTTLGRALLRLIRPNEGRVYFQGKDITRLEEEELGWFRRSTQIVFQDPYGSLDPMYDVYSIVEEPLAVNSVDSPAQRRARVLKALEEVRLLPAEEFAKKYPHQLSGGQRQRVAIARAIVMNPLFVVADEPVSMLDASVRVEILLLMKSLQEKHKISFLYITHDLSTAKYFSDRIAIMYAGKLSEVGPAKEVIGDPLHPYTRALISAIPDPDPSNRLRNRQVIGGEPPSLVAPPRGCRFHPRCPYAWALCEKKEPPLVQVKPGRWVACHLYEGSG